MRSNHVVTTFILVSALICGSAGCADFADEEVFDSEEFDPEAEPLENDGEVFRATCSLNGCNGIDPATTPCPTGSYTVETKPIYKNGTNQQIGYVELRWSPSCQTNWARVTRTDGAYAEGMYATVTRYGGTTLQKWSYKEGYSQIWSPMVYAPDPYCATAKGLIDQSYITGSNTTGCY